MNAAARLLSVACMCAPAAFGADTWVVNMTVDNQFDAYVGTASQTTGSAVGSGNSWFTAYNFTVSGMQPTDYFYVATASDFGGAQGFLGDFTNTTQNFSFNTGTSAWEVFPVGAYLQQIDPNWPGAWPYLTMPTQTEVDQALLWAASNSSVWITPAEFANWDNRATGNITTWGHNPGIDPKAEWIWNNVTGGNPFNPGYNHDEFLIFRVRGVPAPGSLALLGLGTLATVRRRRA
ncbi:MAG TPA: PEP-CTERM sorting domain-containing protein [Phycisphaerales bacterium]|nr:PEP-CTERM sorting domain-containing protein [Phycisphaerales bacterium]